MSGELERCWLCTKIVPKATNPPDIHAEDLCRCADPMPLEDEEETQDEESES